MHSWLGRVVGYTGAFHQFNERKSAMAKTIRRDLLRAGTTMFAGVASGLLTTPQATHAEERVDIAKSVVIWLVSRPASS